MGTQGSAPAKMYGIPILNGGFGIYLNQSANGPRAGWTVLIFAGTETFCGKHSKSIRRTGGVLLPITKLQSFSDCGPANRAGDRMLRGGAEKLRSG